MWRNGANGRGDEPLGCCVVVVDRPDLMNFVNMVLRYATMIAMYEVAFMMARSRYIPLLVNISISNRGVGTTS